MVSLVLNLAIKFVILCLLTDSVTSKTKPTDSLSSTTKLTDSLSSKTKLTNSLGSATDFHSGTTRAESVLKLVPLLLESSWSTLGFYLSLCHYHHVIRHLSVTWGGRVVWGNIVKGYEGNTGLKAMIDDTFALSMGWTCTLT